MKYFKSIAVFIFTLYVWVFSNNLEITSVNINSVYSAAYKNYVNQPIGTIFLRNKTGKNVNYCKVKIIIKEVMYDPSEVKYSKIIRNGKTVKLNLFLEFNKDILKITEDTPMQCKIVVEYIAGNQNKSTEKVISVLIHNRNALTWDSTKRIASFITPKDPPIKEFARSIAAEFKNENIKYYSKNIYTALWIFEAVKYEGLTYVSDPVTPFTSSFGKKGTVDYVQYPREVLQYKSGDCDDLTVLFISLLENLGIATAIITTPGHIYMAFDSGEPLSAKFKYEIDKKNYIVHNNRLWIPIEVTALTKNFFQAWEMGASEYYKALKSNPEFIPTKDAWKDYFPVTLPDTLSVKDDKVTTITSEGNGIISINAVPKIIKVYRDNELIGQTPLFKELEANKAIYLTFIKDGYMPQKTTINLKDGETKEINIMLSKGIGINEAKVKRDKYKKNRKRNIIIASTAVTLAAGGFFGGYYFNKSGGETYTEYGNAMTTSSATELGNKFYSQYSLANNLYLISESGIILSAIFIPWLIIDIINYKKYNEICETYKKISSLSIDFHIKSQKEVSLNISYKF